jgi:coenzyme F420 hydrogenase subunit beta
VLADKFIAEATQYNNSIGKFIGTYAGYTTVYRQTSSSGGIATFLCIELLENGIVDQIFSVKESRVPGQHYEYAVSNTKQQLLEASKTKYFPVTLSEVMSGIHLLKGQVAVVGVACFVKAIRLAQHLDPSLKEKIPFLIGIICGGMKSRFFQIISPTKQVLHWKDIKNLNFA